MTIRRSKLDAYGDIGSFTVRYQPELPWPWHALGAACCRNGKYEQAIDALDRAVELRGDDQSVWDWLFLAMAHHHLENDDEARAWMTSATDWLDRTERVPETRTSCNTI